MMSDISRRLRSRLALLIIGLFTTGFFPLAALAQPGGLQQSELAQTLQQAGRQLSVVAARVMPTVVSIESTRVKQSGTREESLVETGSGVIVKVARSPEVFIVTNRHVVGDARLEKIDISLHDGRMVRPLAVLQDPQSDLAVLKVPELNIPPAEFGESDNLEIGHFVLAVGSPFGLTQSVTLGIISAKGRRALELPGRAGSPLVNQDFLQTDAAINPGNSGGPLIDLNGRVIGINTAIASQGGGNEGIGFSIPSKLVEFVVSQLIETGRVRRGFLGVVLDTKFDAEAARRYGLDRVYGARVVRLEPASPAARAGIQVDDIILNYNGLDVLDESDLINRVGITPVNQQVRLLILRNGKQETVLVQLTERVSATSLREVPPPEDRPVKLISLPVVELDASLARQAGFASFQRGLLVREAVAGTGQEELQAYDVIEQVGRTPVATAQQLETALAQLHTGDRVLLQVRRLVNGKQRTVLVLWTAPSL